MFTSIRDVFYNLAPFCTVIFGYFILNEKVNGVDLVTVVFGFAAVIFITYGMANSKQDVIDPKKNSKEYARHDHLTLLSFVFLISCPLLVAC